MHVIPTKVTASSGPVIGGHVMTVLYMIVVRFGSFSWSTSSRRLDRRSADTELPQEKPSPSFCMSPAEMTKSSLGEVAM